MDYQVGQRIKVRSLEEIKDIHGSEWTEVPLTSRNFIERNAGKIRTVKRIEDLRIIIEEDCRVPSLEFLVPAEIKPLNSIDIPKEMFEL